MTEGYAQLFLLLASHRLTLDLWLAKDNRFLNSKSSYGRILTAPPCRLIRLFVHHLSKEICVPTMAEASSRSSDSHERIELAPSRRERRLSDFVYLGIACLFFLEFTRNSSSAFWLSSRLYAGQKATACKLASVMQNQVTDNFLNSSFWSLHLLAFWFIFVSRPEGYSMSSCSSLSQFSN